MEQFIDIGYKKIHKNPQNYVFYLLTFIDLVHVTLYLSIFLVNNFIDLIMLMFNIINCIYINV